MSHAVLSDTTSVTSPTPFSPFSSAFSVSSEATVVSENDEADLGAFQSVFIALSQLQLHHSQETASHQHGHQSSTLDNDTFTRTTTPSVHPMSPLNLDPYTSSHPPSRIANRSGSSNDTEARSARTERTVDAESDLVLGAAPSVSSAADDGDEESLALTSPNSHPSSDAQSLPDDEVAERGDDTRVWTFTEIPAYPHSLRTTDGTPESDQFPRADDSVSIAEDGEGPSLGDLGSAFAFFAAERAKLAKQLELSKSSTPTTSNPELPGKKNGKRGMKAQRKTGTKNTLSSLVAASTIPDSDESEEARVLGVSGPTLSRHAPGLSSSSVDDTFEMKAKQHRGVLPRPSKTLLKGPKSSTNTTPPVSIFNNTNRRRPGNHRHSRSLPIDASTIGALNASPTPAPATEISRIQSLARRLTFQFPSDAPSLRRVIADPQVALGLGTHVTPSDDALVAEGFFDPVRGDGMTSSSAGTGSDSQSALLHVFIDHSNILVGFLEWLKRQNQQGLHIGNRTGKPKLSHAALVLLLERGRQCLRRVLVASSPLYQSLDQIAGMGYQISVLQRVEIKEGAFGAAAGRNNRSPSSGANLPTSTSTPTLGTSSPMGTPSRNKRKNGKGRPTVKIQYPSETSNNGAHSGSSTESDSGKQHTPVVQTPPIQTRAARRAAGQHHRRTSSDQAFITPSNSSTSLAQTPADTPSTPSTPASRPRFREEAVDELLQLKLLQTLLDTPSPPPPGSTIILASGDAARSQFNPQGFLGCVRKAIERGWNVEVAGWEEGRSRAWSELFNDVERGLVGQELGGKLSIVGLDRWGLDLAEN